jgi:NADP-dependent 3-hydroxy acid dehydrogenase YdfG
VTVRSVQELDASFQHLVCVVDLDEVRTDPAKEAFEWCRAALASGIPSVVAVTGLGGRFGIDSASAGRHGGTAGAVKCLAKEYPEQCARVVDVDLGAAPEELAASLMLELRREDPPVEVGCARGQHVGVRAVASSRSPLERTQLRPDSVVLVVGGLRGITAKISAALHDRYGCRLQILGRTDLSELPQCEGLGDLANALEARRKIAERSQGRASALEIEATRKRLCAVQEAQRTLEALRARGASVDYHCADVRDGAAVSRVLDAIYSRHERIDGVIFAAGVLEDGLAANKTAESFARVYDTKVAGSRNLLAALRADTEFVIFFSSVAATFGNRGQADYAAANDVLDQLARGSRAGSSLRVRSIAWGPWSGAGMVGPDLERLYRERGIDLITVEAGVQAFLDELGSGVEPHVILTAGGWS